MKQTFFLLLVLMQASAQEILWEQSYGGKHAEFLYDALPTPDYGFLLAGSSISNQNGNKTDANKGDLDYWIWKMNEKGMPEWQKSFGGDGVDLLQSVALTHDGGFILAGTSNSNISFDKKNDTNGQEDFWILKLDAKGNEMWQRTIGGSGQEKLLSIVPTRDGGYLLGGTSSSSITETDSKGIKTTFGKTENSYGSLDFWVVKLTKEGNIAWQKTLGGKYVEELKSVVITPDNGYLLGGTTNSPESGTKTSPHFGGVDYWVVALDEKGNEKWQASYGGAQDENLFAMTKTKEGTYILAGNSNSSAQHTKTKSNENGTDFWILQIDALGTTQWQQVYDFGKIDILTSLVPNDDQTYLIGGYAQSEVQLAKTTAGKTSTKTGKDKEGINDYIALKINTKGEKVWTQTVEHEGDEVLRKVVATRDGGYLFAGTSKNSASSAIGKGTTESNSNHGGSDFWVVKLLDKEKQLTEKMLLEAVPNPATTFTNIIVGYDYESGQATVYDLNGRTLQSTAIKAARTLPIDLSAYPDGIYLVEVKTNINTSSVKVIKK